MHGAKITAKRVTPGEPGVVQKQKPTITLAGLYVHIFRVKVAAAKAVSIDKRQEEK
jgi:hypothetical protein